MKIRKLGAIDIGSNGVRLLIANVTEIDGKKPVFSKSSLVRVPIRLGADVFLDGNISPENATRLSDSMKAFDLLMKVNKVEKYMACATSAMREAKNGETIAQEIRKKTGVQIRIIDGAEEAAIIASTDLKAMIKDDKDYLYIDVGGGSTEFTVFSKGQVIASRSFPIGTVRLLDNKVSNKTWKEVEAWIKENTSKHDKLEAIGSGGNINRIFKDSGRKKDQPLTYKFLRNHAKYLSTFSYEQRVYDLGYNPDRADVITHALSIYLNAMKWSKAKRIHVPKIGLSDGIIKTLYDQK
ncbi:Ppx/GppA phosphatase family protein [Capnocytophaga canimorsus]|uniref:Putative Exopolyphosphatase n=1 Tax=Capnocytophaga canimorsus TaxID=28188 RepID=A0A0B7IDC6_9FLAO|nr:rod shape-determining protein [Capnocytophaga canimorsus]CEN49936.1 putative Exopolyphosphatase [Capnocytophaga canimorsus]